MRARPTSSSGVTLPVALTTVPAPTAVSTVGFASAVAPPPVIPIPSEMLPMLSSARAPFGDALSTAPKPMLRPPSMPFPAAKPFTVGWSSAEPLAPPPEKPRLAPKPLPSAKEVSVAVAVKLTSPRPPSTWARSPTYARIVGLDFVVASVDPPVPRSAMFSASTLAWTFEVRMASAFTGELKTVGSAGFAAPLPATGPTNVSTSDRSSA